MVVRELHAVNIDIVQKVSALAWTLYRISLCGPINNLSIVFTRTSLSLTCKGQTYNSELCMVNQEHKYHF